MQPGTETTVNTLNSFLRNEMSAVESYRQALDKVEKPPIKTELENCLRSHEQRVSTIKQRIQNMGGEPAQSSGAWGALGKLVAGSAGMLGDKAAITALEEGEDGERDEYKKNIDQLDPDSRELVEAQLLPEQLRTHAAISSLKKTL